MELNRLCFQARPRSAYEVFDLTILLTKQHFLKLFCIYTCFVVPLFIALALAYNWVLAGIVIWWLKPLFERPLLDYLSKVVFNQTASIGTSIKSIVSLSIKDILLGLTFFRLSPNRSFLAPVDQLERLSGERKSKRRTLLFASTQPKQTLWLLFCVHFELILLFSIFTLMAALVPESITVVDELFSFDSGFMSTQAEMIYYSLYVLSVALVAPFFVCGGFLAYLHRRIELEGWDIELKFKNIKARVTPMLSAFVISCICWFASVENTAMANELDVAQIKQQVDALYNEEGVIEKKTTWAAEEKESDVDFDSDFLSALADVLLNLGQFAAYIFWFLVAALALWLAYYLYMQRGFFAGIKISKEKKDTAVIPTLFADITKDDIPSDLIAAAKQAVKNNNWRLALAYLLHFTLTWAQHTHQVRLHRSMTEGECERAMLAKVPNHSHELVQSLFNYWIQVAWAHQTPSINFEQLIGSVERLGRMGEQHES